MLDCDEGVGVSNKIMYVILKIKITAAFHQWFQKISMRSSQLRSHLLTAGIRKIKFPKPLKLNLVLIFFKHYGKTEGRTHTGIYFCPVAYILLRNNRNVDLQSYCLATKSTLSNGRLLYEPWGLQWFAKSLSYQDT